MRFSVFTHVPHKQKENFFFGYAPYIREMNLWMKYVEKVEIVAPLVNAKISSAEIAYQKNSLNFHRVPSLNFLSFRKVFLSFLQFPKIIFEIFRVMQSSDHIHLRCPGNIGLLACFVQILFPKKPKTAKYAGNWDPEAKQPWSYKLQKWILNNTFLSRNMKVLVYGEWPNQTKNIIPFFTASFSETDIPVPEKIFREPFLFLFVGNLVPGKNPLFAIKLVEELKKKNYLVQLEIYGDGILKAKLEEYCALKNLNKTIIFKGSQPLGKVKNAYEKAHFLILASESEGWPKAVAEAMFFGVIPIATAVSCVPWMLGYGKRGVLIHGEAEVQCTQRLKKEKTEKQQGGEEKWRRGEKGRDGISEEVKIKEENGKVFNAVVELMNNPKEMLCKSDAAKEWSQQYTLEKFEAAIKKVIG